MTSPFMSTPEGELLEEEVEGAEEGTDDTGGLMSIEGDTSGLYTPGGSRSWRKKDTDLECVYTAFLKNKCLKPCNYVIHHSNNKITYHTHLKKKQTCRRMHYEI